jgi:hypothetical protein
VQHRPVLGDIDPVPAQHRIAPAGEVDVVGQAHEGREDVGVEEVLGEVDVQVGAVEGELPGTVRVALEGAPQVRGVCRVQALEVVPGWRGSGIDKAHTASLCPLAWTG